MESWTAALLPRPQNTYPFVDDAGVLRTTFDVGIQEQAQKWTNGWRTYTVEVALTAAELRPSEVFLAENGYSWFLFPLISDVSAPGQCPNEAEVRMTAAPRYSAVAADRIMLSLTLEAKFEASPGNGGAAGKSMTYDHGQTPETVAASVTSAQARMIELRSTTWSDAGLPPPQNTYTYEDDAGVLRTGFDVGIQEQARKYLEGWRKFKLEFWVTGDQLKTAEEYIAAVGYREFSVPVMAHYSLTERGCAREIPMRIISQPVYKTLAADLFELSFDTDTRYSMGFRANVLDSQFQVMFAGSLATRSSQFMVQLAGPLATRSSQFMVQYAGRFGARSSQFMVQRAGIMSDRCSQFMVQHAGIMPNRCSQFMVQGAISTGPYT